MNDTTLSMVFYFGTAVYIIYLGYISYVSYAIHIMYHIHVLYWSGGAGAPHGLRIHSARGGWLGSSVLRSSVRMSHAKRAQKGSKIIEIPLGF